MSGQVDLSVGTARPRLAGGFASVWSRQAGSGPEASGESGVDRAIPRILAAFNMRNGEEAGRFEISTHHGTRAAAIHLDVLLWVQSAAQPTGLAHWRLLVFI